MLSKCSPLNSGFATNFGKSEITVIWEFKYSGNEVLTRWNSTQRTGFSIDWYMMNSDGTRMEKLLNDKETWAERNMMTPIYARQTQSFVSFANIAQSAIEKEIDHEFVLSTLSDYREYLKLGSVPSDCKNSIMDDYSYFLEFLRKLNMTWDGKMYTNVSEAALLNGFELYSSFRYCPNNILIDLVLQEFFLSLESPRAMTQGAANVINSGLIVDPVNLDHLRQFCLMLSSVFDLDLMYVLSRELSNDDLQAMIEDRHPFLSFNSSTTKQPNAKTTSMMARLSSHPVHLTSESHPSAFIPFCAYQTNMLALGQFIDSLEFPVCNKFTPTVDRGQLCYTIDVSSVLPDAETKDGKSNGLTLLLDYNSERSVLPVKIDQTDEESKNIFLDLEDSTAKEDSEAKIFIHTLKPFKGYGSGGYSMSALKQISPTGNFLGLPNDVRDCALEDTQLCTKKKYLHHKLKDCQCLPWEFPKSVMTEVRNIFFCTKITMILFRMCPFAHQRVEIATQMTMRWTTAAVG